MLRRTPLSLAISAAVGITSMTISPAYAQDVLEEVYVTGTRIARDGFEMASPVDVFTAEDLAESGMQSVDEFRLLPVANWVQALTMATPVRAPRWLTCGALATSAPWS